LRNSQYIGSASLAKVITVAQAAQGADEHGLRREFIELVKNAQSLKR
jgi:hypothetical protein